VIADRGVRYGQLIVRPPGSHRSPKGGEASAHFAGCVGMRPNAHPKKAAVPCGHRRSLGRKRPRKQGAPERSCETQNGLRRCSMQALIAAMQHFFRSLPDMLLVCHPPDCQLSALSRKPRFRRRYAPSCNMTRFYPGQTRCPGAHRARPRRWSKTLSLGLTGPRFGEAVAASVPIPAGSAPAR